MGAVLSEPVTAMVVESSSSDGWAAAIAEMQGWRRTHEDASIFCQDGGGPEESAVFAVLDGHGGHTCAHAAAVLLQEHLLRLARRGTLESTVATQELQAAFLEADSKLREKLSAEDKSGSTVVAAIITRPRPTEYCVQLAHCGDSRAIVCKGDDLICSEDHKPGRQDELERIRAAGGSVERGALGGGPLRVDGALAVSRSMGDFPYKPRQSDPVQCKVTALPEVATVPGCHAGDWVFLACDGVFDVMSNEEVRDFMQPRLRQEKPGIADGGKILVDLLKLCLDKGSKDNCTACLVQLQPGCPVQPVARKLLRGGFAKAPPEVRDKYVEFFTSHGFTADAGFADGGSVAAKSTGGAGLPGAMPSAGPGASGPAAGARGPPPKASGAAGGGGGPMSAGTSALSTVGQQRAMALAKALQARSSARASQSPWRSRGAAGTGSSGAASASAVTGPASAGGSAAGTRTDRLPPAAGAAAGPTSRGRAPGSPAKGAAAGASSILRKPRE